MLHDQEGEVPVEDLDGVVKDLIFDEVIVVVLGDVLGVDTGFAFLDELDVGVLGVVVRGLHS